MTLKQFFLVAAAVAVGMLIHDFAAVLLMVLL